MVQTHWLVASPTRSISCSDENICKKHSREICQRDPKRGGSLPFSREDMKWSLGVVRSYAFNVTKRTTGKTFLALFPYSNLIHHRHGGTSWTTLYVDRSAPRI